MIDVSSKPNTFRYALAEGRLFASPETLEAVRQNQVPKGDVCQVARAAGIAAAKKTPDIIVFCHSIPIDWIEVSVNIRQDCLFIQCQVSSVWKTGVEMEALAGVTAALLNAYDMLKPIDKSMTISEIRLVEKKGGRSSFTESFDRTLKAAVLVISDSTFAGTREDKSGKIIADYLKKYGIEVSNFEVLPDDLDKIQRRLIELADVKKVDLIFTTGGTGLGPKDLTPEATKPVLDKEAPGIAEAMRQYGLGRTPFAMLSRQVCGLRKQTLILNLPGSSKGAKESMDALMPGLLHAFSMIMGGGHDKK